LKQTRDELLEHLGEQREWLAASSNAFDAGVMSEAKRLASVARTLLQSDGALLAQLGVRDTMQYADSVGDNSATLVAMGPVSMTPDGSGGFTYGVDLDPVSERSLFDPWWNNVIIKSTQYGGLRRRDIVLRLANIDGGSHVDPTLPQAYRAITRENGMGWVVLAESGENPDHPGNPVPWAMRMIAHELTISVDEAFPKI
jgi:hypothetical protein